MFKQSRKTLWLTYLDIELAAKLELSLDACRVEKAEPFVVVEFPSEAARNEFYVALYRAVWGVEP